MPHRRQDREEEVAEQPPVVVMTAPTAHATGHYDVEGGATSSRQEVPTQTDTEGCVRCGAVSCAVFLVLAVMIVIVVVLVSLLVVTRHAEIKAVMVATEPPTIPPTFTVAPTATPRYGRTLENGQSIGPFSVGAFGEEKFSFLLEHPTHAVFCSGSRTSYG